MPCLSPPAFATPPPPLMPFFVCRRADFRLLRFMLVAAG
jgi:hypothetical protein